MLFTADRPQETPAQIVQNFQTNIGVLYVLKITDVVS